MSNRQNLLQIVIPIIICWKYTGLPIYTIDSKSQKIIHTNTKTFLFGLIILSLIFYVSVQDIYKNGEELISENYIDLIQFSILFIHQSLIVVLSYNKRSQFAQIFSQLVLLDKKITKLTTKKIFFILQYQDVF